MPSIEQQLQDFTTIINGIADAFGIGINDNRIDVYFEHLTDLTLESISYAATEIIRNEERFPVVAVIRRYANQYKPPRPAANLSTTALPEFTEQQHADASKELKRLLASFEKWGTA